MAIILDTDVIIRGEKGLFDLQGWLQTNSSEDIEIAAITVAELWHGVERAIPQHRQKREDYLQAALQVLPIIPYTDQVAREHARLWAQLETQGKMTGYYDLIVAATALHRGSALATFNRKHFENIPGLDLRPL